MHYCVITWEFGFIPCITFSKMSNYKTGWADLGLMARGGFVSLNLTESHQVKTKATLFPFFVFLSDGYRT